MQRLSLVVLLVVLAAAAATPMRRLHTSTALARNTTVSQAGNAAFRDGLYLGKFDAESGRTRHLCVGRWSSDVNRVWFTAGYQAGYQQVNPLRAEEE